MAALIRSSSLSQTYQWTTVAFTHLKGFWVQQVFWVFQQWGSNFHRILVTLINNLLERLIYLRMTQASNCKYAANFQAGLSVPAAS